MIKTKSKKRLWILFVQLTVNKEGKRSHNKRTKGKLTKKIEQREKKKEKKKKKTKHMKPELTDYKVRKLKRLGSYHDD